MQVGQILVEQRWVEPEALARALAEQRATGKRICSLLIERGLLDPDNAARALANQHNVPGVLQKHLENRDPSLARLLPPAFARACFALPIGRTRNHELIVCVRDPRPELREIIAAAAGTPVVIAVAPAHQLEQLIKRTYEAMPSPGRVAELSFDVDLSTRLIATLPNEPAPASAPPPRDLEEVEVDLHTRQIAVLGDGLSDLGSMTLVELDDVRVDKDPSQSGQHAAVLPRTMTAPYPPSRTTTTQYPSPARTRTMPASLSPAPAPASRTMTSPYSPAPGATPATHSTRATIVPLRAGALSELAMTGPTLDTTIAALDRTVAHDEATELAMRYLAGRFHHAVLFAIDQGVALGDRGHGGQLTAEVVQAITLPLSAPSLIQVAHDTQRLATAAPANAGAIQDRLARTLGNPQASAAVPIEVDEQVAYVIAVGDATGDPGGAGYDLERLARVLGAAYQRLR